MSKMNLPSNNSMLFNGGAGLLIVVGAVALIRTTVFPTDSERCTARYTTATSFDLGDDNGEPLVPGAIQGRLGPGHWGILRNLKIERRSSGARDLVMQIGLSRTLGAPGQDDELAGGLGFRWVPGFLANKSSACLSYDVRLPKGFDFRDGGLLPGLFAGQDDDELAAQSDDDVQPDDEAEGENAPRPEGFSTRLGWDGKGNGGVHVQYGRPHRGQSSKRTGLAKFALPTERWVNLEQEISLNSPGQQDGTLRVWVDGDLVFEKNDIRFRNKTTTGLLGVYADTTYIPQRLQRQQPRPQSLSMTPFKLLWN